MNTPEDTRASRLADGSAVVREGLDGTFPDQQLAPCGTACVKCEYALDGLSIDGVCPECSEAIRSALNPSLIRFATEDTLRQTRWSVRLLRLAIAVTLVSAIGILTLWLWAGGAMLIASLYAIFGSVLVMGFAWLLAWWCVAGAAGDLHGVTRSIRWRCVVVGVGWGVAIGSLIATLAGVPQPPTWVRFPMFFVSFILLSQVMDRTRRVLADTARRVPNEALAGRIERSRHWLLGTLIFAFVALAGGFALGGRGSVAGSVVSMVFGVAAAVMLGLWIDVVLKWCSAIDRQVRLARQRV